MENATNASQSSQTTTKRRKVNNVNEVPLPDWLLANHNLEEDDFWETAQLYAHVEDTPYQNGIGAASSSKRKRAVSDHDERTQPVIDGIDGQELLEQVLPGSTPGNPNPDDRSVDLLIANPYIMTDDGEVPNHPRLTSLFDPVIIPNQLRVNGLVKFHLQFNDKNVPQRTKDALASYRKEQQAGEITSAGDVSYLPRDFGRGLNLDEMDMRLFKFYLVAFCAGRTLLDRSNVWLKGVPAIAEKSPCVRHAMLSVSAGYVLDYAPSEKLKRKANFHHKRAVMLVGNELNDPSNYEVGKEEPLLMALALLNCEDTVNWETRESTKRNPRWYQGCRAIKNLLDLSDPGYYYRHPMNVQSTTNRYCMSHYQMKNLILSDTCAPLEAEANDHAFRWLLEGNAREVRRITGLAGCCAKVLHVFAQITELCKQLKANPDSLAVAAAGKIVLERLTNFKQWSDLAESFTTSEELFEACQADRNEHGKVTKAALSVALNGEAYVQAAQIYLLCRLFRRPRRHPEVQRRLRNLMKCTDWVPLSGPLFTAQDSLYGLAMAGLGAVEEEDRNRLRTQFGPLETGSRGNDVPVCRMLERLWLWLDEHSIDHDIGEKPLKDRVAWWELMTDHIFETEGRLNMS